MGSAMAPRLRGRPHRIYNAFRFTLLFAIAILWLAPIAWMLSTSITINERTFTYPIRWLPDPATLQNYRAVITNPRLSILTALWNSTAVAVVQISVILAIDAMAAYAFARFRFPGRDLLFGIVVGTLIIPGYMIIVPLFLLVSKMGLVNTIPGLFLPGLPRVIGIFLLRQFFITIPKELEDAAYMDGAGSFQIFTHVILPIGRPALATLAIFTFLYSWNNFLWPLVVINEENKMTLTVALAFLLRGGHTITKYGDLMAGAFIATLPSIVVFVFAKRFIVRGIATQGLKE
jgi:multiple sugar transport system permease protein